MRKNKLSRQKRRFIISALGPIVLLLSIFSFLPILADIIISFFDFNLFGNSEFIFWDNYKNLPQIDGFWKIVANTFVFGIVTTLINILIAMMLAISIYALRKKRTKNFFRTTFFLPAVLPIVAVSYIWTIMFDAQSGIVNGLLKMLGYRQPVYWLTEPKTAMLSIMIVTLFVDLGYNLVLFLTGLDNIPKTFLEAARIDGAGNVRLFFSIILPLMKRTLGFVGVMTVISYFQVFGQIDILTKGGPDNATNMLSYSVYQYAFGWQQMGTGAALSVILLAIMLSMTAVQLFFGKTDWEY